MAIEEQPIKIKFTYKPGISNYPFIDVRYSIIDKIPVILFKDQGSESDWEATPLAFFIEVVDFLTEKGVIKRKEEVIKEKVTEKKDDSILSLPNITTMENIEPQNPVSSFSVSSSDIPSPQQSDKPNSPIIVNNESEAKIIKEGKEEATNMPQRAVIRTRVTDVDGDPLEAERDAAQLRGDSGAHQIKSSHR